MVNLLKPKFQNFGTALGCSEIQARQLLYFDWTNFIVYENL
jgi:hypothetical protein